MSDIPNIRCVLTRNWREAKEGKEGLLKRLYVIKEDGKMGRIKYADIQNNLTQKITELEKRGGEND